MSPFPFFPPNLTINLPLLQNHGLFFNYLLFHARPICMHVHVYICMYYTHICIYVYIKC